MTGTLNMSNNKVTNVADPTANGDAVNKKYVDDKATETETTLKEYVNEHSGGFENATAVGVYDIRKAPTIPRETNFDYLFICYTSLGQTHPFFVANGETGTKVNTGGVTVVATAGNFTANGTGYLMVYRVAVTPEPVDPPVDPATKFNLIDLSNYTGSFSGSTVNTASDFNAALQ